MGLKAPFNGPLGTHIDFINRQKQTTPKTHNIRKHHTHLTFTQSRLKTAGNIRIGDGENASPEQQLEGSMLNREKEVVQHRRTNSL